MSGSNAFEDDILVGLGDRESLGQAINTSESVAAFPNELNQSIVSRLLQKSTSQLRGRSYSDPGQDDKLKHYAVGLIPPLPQAGVALLSSDEKSVTLFDAQRGNQLLGVFMLCSVSLGIGVFVLPSVLLLTGIGPGMLLMLLFAVMSTFSQLLVIDVVQDIDVNSFEALASQSLGKWGEFSLALFMAVSLLMGNCGHIQTVGQLLHDIIEWFWTNDYGKHRFDWEKTAVLYSIMLSLTLPWLFQKNLHGLSGVGSLSVTVVLITATSLIVICLYKLAFTNNYAHSDDAPSYGFQTLSTSAFWITNLWRAAPTFAFTYTSLLELFPVYVELYNKDRQKTKQAIIMSGGICFTIYAVVAVIAVCTFGTDTDANSLYNIGPRNYWMTFWCFCLVIVITLLYPVINYPMLNAIETMLDMFDCCKSCRRNTSNSSSVSRSRSIRSRSHVGIMCVFRPTSWPLWLVAHRRDVISVLGIFLVIAIDIGVHNLADLFGLCGALGLSFVCYLFPVLIYFKVKWRELRWADWKVWFSVFVLLFSAFIMVYSTVVIIQHIVGS